MARQRLEAFSGYETFSLLVQNYCSRDKTYEPYVAERNDNLVQQIKVAVGKGL
jgi:hypothetical protein